MTMIGRWGLAAGIALFAAGGAEAETAIPLATWGGQSHVGVREFPPAMERALKELQPHGIKFQHFPGGQLGQDKDMPIAVPTGQVKFAWITVNGWSGTVRDTKVMDAPTGLSMAQLDAIVDKPGGLLEQLQKGFLAKNSVLLGLADLGPPALVSKVPLLKPADFKGKKIRVFSEGTADAVRALGGSPVQIPFADVYTAMQYGTVDAAILGFQGVESQRMYEVGKHVLVAASFFGTTMMGWAANKTWFESLPEADRAVFVKAVDKASRHNRQAIREEIEQLTKSYRDRGMTVTFLSEQMPEYALFKKAFDPVLAASLKQLSPPVAALVAPK